MEEDPLQDHTELERLVDELFDRSDAQIHAIMHEIARRCIAEVIIE